MTKQEKIRIYKKKWRDNNKDKVKAYHIVWYAKNKDRCRKLNKLLREKYNADPIFKQKRREYQIEYEKNNPDKKEHRYFLTKRRNAGFDLSFEDYKKLIKSQLGLCVICGMADRKRALTVDHCHKTNKVRGLLCNKCNTAIGMFGDSPELVLKAYNYLIKSL